MWESGTSPPGIRVQSPGVCPQWVCVPLSSYISKIVSWPGSDGHASTETPSSVVRLARLAGIGHIGFSLVPCPLKWQLFEKVVFLFLFSSFFSFL